MEAMPTHRPLRSAPRRRRLRARLSVVAALVLAAGVLAGGPSGAAPPSATPRAASDRCLIGVSHAIFLDRPATEAEKQSWSDRFDGGEPRYRLPQALAASDEWLTVVVTGLYQDALDRDPEPAGLTYWIDRLRAGDLVNRVAALVYGSPEYDANAGGTTAAFVTDIYTRILHRAPDASGQAYWEGRVATLGRGAVAASFFASVESRGDRVDALYGLILGRPSDSDGRAYWIDRLATVNDVRLAVLLASSDELAARAPSTCARLERIGGDGNTIQAATSADGRHVAFASFATDLVPGDTNGQLDVFVRDLTTGRTTQITEGDGTSNLPDISADGSSVVFTSVATDLVRDDANGVQDVFLWERDTGTTTRLTPGDDASSLNTRPSISADGGLVTFSSRASDLVTGDDNGEEDIFVLDRKTGTTTRITDGNRGSNGPSLSDDGAHVTFQSTASDLVPGASALSDIYSWERATGVLTRVTDGDGGSFGPRPSGDGRHISFQSAATDLVPGDANDRTDVFTWDRATATTTRLTDGDGISFETSISDDGRLVAFKSEADDLVPGDANGQIDVFLWDRSTGVLERAVHGNGGTSQPSLSGAGRVLAVSSGASDLVAGDDNGRTDVFVRTYLG